VAWGVSAYEADQIDCSCHKRAIFLSQNPTSSRPANVPTVRPGANHIFHPERPEPYPGALGTAIVCVFAVAAGITGRSENACAAGRVYHTVTRPAACDEDNPHANVAQTGCLHPDCASSSAVHDILSST